MKDQAVRRAIFIMSAALLIISICVCAVFISRKANAIRTIERAGGHILFDYHDTGDSEISPPSISVETGEVATRIRDDSFHRWVECPVLADPVIISLDNVKVNDAVLQELRRFPYIKRLQYGSLEPNVTSKEWLFLEEFTELQFLLLAVKDSQNDDELLSRVKCWPKLRWLILTGCDASDVGLVHCEDHPSLAVLMLDGRRITDDSVESLRKIPNLSLLSLGPHVSISEKGILELQNAKPSLRILSVAK